MLKERINKAFISSDSFSFFYNRQVIQSSHSLEGLEREFYFYYTLPNVFIMDKITQQWLDVKELFPPLC